MDDSRLNAKEKEIVEPDPAGIYQRQRVSFPKVLTRLQEEKTLALVNPVFIQLKKDKIILRRGDEMSKDHLRLIHLIRRRGKDRRAQDPRRVFRSW